MCIHTTTQNISQDTDVLENGSTSTPIVELFESLKPTNEDYIDIFETLSESTNDYSPNNGFEEKIQTADVKIGGKTKDCVIVEQTPSKQCSGQKAECWSAGTILILD